LRELTRSLCVGAVLCLMISQFAIGSGEERILGISGLKVRQGYIELTCDFAATSGLSLTLDSPTNASASGNLANGRVDVRNGESFTVSDGHHLAMRYALLGIRNGMASIETLDQSAFPGFENASPKKRAAEFHDYRLTTTESPGRSKQ
jgi:hypothetical protein